MADKTLHITNGDVTASLLRAARIAGDKLPWRDVLHDGPVPGGLTHVALSRVRAEYLSEIFLKPTVDVHRDFATRDARLERCDDYDEVILWFEHDLYDQLQILQLLDWLHMHPPRHARCTLICIDDFPGIERFQGLGQLTPRQITTLVETRSEITPRQIKLASRGWQAFTHADPLQLIEFCDEDLTCLPFMRDAIQRLVQEYPSAQNGLSRTQQQILQIVAAGEHRPGQLFVQNGLQEEAPYMGDWSFWQRLEALCREPHALLKCEPSPFRFPPSQPVNDAFRAQRITTTETGCEVLADRADRLRLHPIDIWIGGTHICSSTTLWRWDRATGTVREDRDGWP